MSVSSDPCVIVPPDSRIACSTTSRVGEVEKERDQIGEALVERGHVDVGRIEKRRPQSVEQRVRRLVRDDVVAERGADQAALEREAGRFLSGAEVAERQVAGFTAVAGVDASEAERPHDEAQRPVGGSHRRPRDVPAERASECGVREAADGIHHLHVETAVGRCRREPAREEEMWIVEIERLGPIQRELLWSALTVDREERPDRTRLQLLVRHEHRGDAAQAVGHRRVERVDPQRPDERRARVALIRPDGGLKAYAVAHVVRLDHGRGRLLRLRGLWRSCFPGRATGHEEPYPFRCICYPAACVRTTSRSGDRSTIRKATPPSRARTTTAPSSSCQLAGCSM